MEHGQRFNVLSHLAGLVLTLGSAVHAGTLAWGRADIVATVGVLVFLATAAALYLASVVAHSTRGEAQHAWERLDRGAIFLLIAGSLTPFALSVPRQPENLLAMSLMWLLAGFAFLRQLFGQAALSAVPGYLILGWGSVVAAIPVAARLSGWALAWLLAGAVLYSIGTLFYLNRRGWAHAHGIWHVLVVGGTCSHYAAVCHLA